MSHTVTSGMFPQGCGDTFVCSWVFLKGEGRYFSSGYCTLTGGILRFKGRQTQFQGCWTKPTVVCLSYLYHAHTHAKGNGMCLC